MRKALLPMLASLFLCGSATAALIATTAHAQPDQRKPMMVALVTSGETAAPATDGGRSQRHGIGARGMRSPADIAARFKQMCQDRYARAAGALAYTEAKLSLTSTQQPLFEQWKQVKLGIARRQADACGTRERPKSAKMPSLIDNMARREDMLKRRLADLDAERPVLESFYNALSPAQKQTFGRGMGGRRMGGHRMFAGARGMMGPGMMNRGGMGQGGAPPPGAMGDGPPGLPPQ